jgi:hypothetical protein
MCLAFAGIVHLDRFSAPKLLVAEVKQCGRLGWLLMLLLLLGATRPWPVLRLPRV